MTRLPRLGWALLVVGAAACGGPQQLGQAGTKCFRDDDCVAGLICVAPVGKTSRVCSSDTTPIVSMVEGPPVIEGGTAGVPGTAGTGGTGTAGAPSAGAPNGGGGNAATAGSATTAGSGGDTPTGGTDAAGTAGTDPGTAGTSTDGGAPP